MTDRETQRLSIVLVSWNTRDRLGRCLETVAASAARAPFGVETIVVDNASADDTLEMLAGRFPWVEVVASRTNPGFAAGCNRGIARARGALVLLLNPDTELDPDALTELVGALDAHDAAAAGARLTEPDGALQASCSRFPTLTRELVRLLHLGRLLPSGAYPMDDWDMETVRSVDVIQGACLLVRREMLDEVGALDEEYVMYTEEVDLCRRIARAGGRIIWVPSAHVVHHGAESTRQVAEEMFFRLYESKTRYFRKHQGAIGAAAYKMVLLVASLARLVLAPLALLTPASRRRPALALARRYAALVPRLPTL